VTNAAATWGRLVEAGIVEGEPPETSEPPMAWYLRALAALAAWIAAFCVLSSTSVLFLHAFDHAATSFLVGAVLLAIGAWVLARARGRVFVAQFGLAFAIAGESAIGLGIAEATKPHEALAWALVGACEAILLAAIADRTHRALAALAVGLCAFFLLARLGPLSLAAPILAIAFVAAALRASRDARSDALWRPASAGFGVALLAFAPLADLAHDAARWLHTPPDVSHGVPAVLMAIAFVAVVALIARRLAVTERRVTLVALIGAVAIAALAHPVPGLLAALVVMLVAFATGRPALTGLGIACAIGMLGYYYFSLEATLIAKSASLAAIGAVLIAVGLALRHVARADGEPRHA
jgi:hypothetical protein